MTAHRFLLAVALVLGGAFVAGAAAYFPADFWTAPRLFAAGMVPASLGLLAWTGRARSTDAGLAAMGISGALCLAHLLVSARVFAFAIDGEGSLTLVFCIANLAFGALILLVARAALPVIERNIERNDQGSEYARVARDLAGHAAGTEDAGLRDALLALAEDLRYFPRHVALDGPLPGGVDDRASDLARAVAARDWMEARAALANLRGALEASRRSILTRYSKA